MQVKVPEGKLRSISHGGVSWTDIENPTQKETEALAEKYPFHHLNLEDCLSRRQLTKLDKHEEYLFILLHFPSYDEGKQNVVTNQVSIFLGKDYLVTLHRDDFKPLIDLFQSCERDEHSHQAFMGKSSAHLLYCVIDKLVDELFPELDVLMSDLSDIEDKAFDERVSIVGKISSLRRQVGDLRRMVSSLRRTIPEVAVSAQRFATEDLGPYFSDVKDHVEKVWETLEQAKETIEIYVDTDFILSTEKTNNVLAILTIVFTLTIPASVVASVYGMNVNLPGGIQTGPWTFLGPYTMLVVLLSIALVPSLAMVYYFRKLGWM